MSEKQNITVNTKSSKATPKQDKEARDLLYKLLIEQDRENDDFQGRPIGDRLNTKEH